MPAPIKLLILGGTAEAMALARALADDSRTTPLLSLAGRTKNPAVPPIPWRRGGFGGAEGLADFLVEGGFDALIDATHPFAARISANAQAASTVAGIPLLALRRPPWKKTPGAHWISVPDIAAAAQALGITPRRVFLTIGRQDLVPFREAPWHHYLIRSVDPPDPAFLPPDCAVIAARGPFSRASECELLAAHKIDLLVTKNSGGVMREKLDAAHALGIPVVMVDRPAPSAAVATADGIAGVMAWLDRLHGVMRGV